MALVEISNFPGTPKLRCRVPNGTLFYDWLAANDATFHRDLLIVRNGVRLGDDDELAFELSELDNIQIFDQPKGIVGDILSPIFKVVGQVFSFLAPKPAIANNGGNAVDSPNNSLTGQTNTARVYKAKPDIYGQIRSFPDLIQESVFEYVHQTSTDGGLKYVTEWMCIGIGKYDYESVRYSESSLGSLAGAEFQFFQPGEVIPQIVEGYGFDDVDGQEVPGQNEASDFPIETATANTVVSGTYSGGQIAMKIVKQADFDYFMGLVLPHAVTFTINVTYNTASGSVTTDANFSGTLISAVETNDGAVVNPVRWYTFTMNQLEGPQDIPATVFNRTNMKTDEYKMTYEATLPGGYDGVQVSYVHPTTNNKTYINYRVLNGAIVEQEAENPNKLEIVGFRNEYQARERALRETKRLIYSRVKMNAKVFEDGIIQVGSVIQMPDIYDSNQQQGYITGRSGNNFDTSEPITFNGSMYVLVTDSLGNPTPRYPATARSDTKYGFTAAIPGIQLNIWNGDTVQLPSRYLIATVEELDSQLWTVNSIKPNTDNTVSLTVAEYSDAIYQ